MKLVGEDLVHVRIEGTLEWALQRMGAMDMPSAMPI